MEVNELKVVAHFVLVLNLGFGFENRSLQRHVLRLQLFYKLVLLLEFVKHVLSKFLSIVLPDSAVFCSAKEATEVEGFFADFSDRKVSAFENRLQSFKQGL